MERSELSLLQETVVGELVCNLTTEMGKSSDHELTATLLFADIVRNAVENPRRWSSVLEATVSLEREHQIKQNGFLFGKFLFGLKDRHQKKRAA